MNFRSLALIVGLFVASDAIAVAQRTFVASYGNDADTCTLFQPCRGFAAAVAAVAPGGEVIVLDSAGYGPVSISKPVSIIAPRGIYAGIAAPSGSAMVINIPTGAVVVSGLTITGGGGQAGISFASGTELWVDNTTISEFGSGIDVFPLTPATVHLKDSTLRKNGLGLYIGAHAAPIIVDVDSSRFEQNSVGALLTGSLTGMVIRSSFSGNTNDGAFLLYTGSPDESIALTFRNCIFASNVYAGFRTSGDQLMAQIVDSETSDNGYGVSASNGARIVVSGTGITRNGTGLDLQTAGTIKSFGDNRLFDNATDGAFTSTLSKQ